MKKRSLTKRPAAGKTAPPATIDEYLAALPDVKRRALARLRAQIHAAAPEATESISYGVPTYKLGGRPLIYFAAAATHLSLYAVSGNDAKGAPMPELRRYATSGKGTLRFPVDEPLPAALVTKLVTARIAVLKRDARY